MRLSKKSMFGMKAIATFLKDCRYIILALVVFCLFVWPLNHLIYTSPAEKILRKAHVSISCRIDLVDVAPQDQPLCGTPGVSAKGVPYTQLVGLTALDAAYLCTKGYKEKWTNNHGRSGPTCRGFDGDEHDWMYGPADNQLEGTAPWCVTWQMKSPSGKVVLEAKYPQ